MLTLVGAPPAHAANLVVTSSADSGPGTLRNIVAAAAPGDVITFAVPGVVLTTAQIVINKNLTIRGGTDAGPTQIARTGPGVFRLFDITAGTVVTIDLVILGQGAANSGGAIRNNGTLTLTRSTLTTNSATVEGGALFNRPGATATVTNTLFSDNSVTGPTATRGGAIANAGTLTVSNSRMQYNLVTGGPFAGGGGIANMTGGTLTVVDTRLEANQATSTSGDAGGGGILHESATTLSVTNSILTDNTVTGSPSRGGGLAAAGPATLDRLEVSDNDAAGPGNRLGGGVHIAGAAVTITNATLAFNTGSHGGALFRGGPGTSTLRNSTVSANTTSVGGAVESDAAGTLSVQSTIVASQSSGANCSGTVSNGGNNLQFGDTSCPGFTVGDPLLGPLNFNGGVSRTMAITSATSPAVDTGSCANAPTDQRGFPRVGQCDIGAYEFGSILADVTGPACSVVGVLATNPKQMDVSVQDTGSGLLTIYNVTITNGTFRVPYFLPGSTLPTVVAAVKSVQTSPTSFAFDAVDFVGNTRHCA